MSELQPQAVLTGTLVIKRVLKKTKARFFSELQEKDILQIRYKVYHTSPSRTLETNVYCSRLEKSETNTIGIISRHLTNFETVQIW